ncbi:DUF6807 family protein [Galbibacter mesophilus]|uniref:DUF6807 family protein n=1 Tax=Galbibacter mesophilus TaxID=379069 RepID=UPI00191F86C1|nr:DUF6807 family protein [Galbibacter mesophilus]MCM5663811.1 PmoA family protein [Galbibacter mesophilus]
MKARSFLLLSVILFGVNLSSAQNFNVEKTDQGLLVSEGDQKVFFYQKETKSLDGKYPRANYLHPLYDLDGNVLTEDFPEDHPHHRGVFWTWHQVLVDGKGMGDAWLCEDFNWEVTKLASEENSDGSLSLSTDVNWLSPHFQEGNQPFVQEKATISVHPSTTNYRVIDFEITLQPLVDNVKIGGSNDIKGYGGFSTRILLPEDIVFTSEGNRVTPKTEAVKAGNYINMEASFQGKDTSGLIIIASTDNPKPIDEWILRKENSMQNAVYPGKNPVALSKTTPTVLKYRLVLYKKSLSNSQLKMLTDF